MTFTYLPSASPTDTTKIRYHIGDTDEDGAMFSDEEIAMALAIEGTVGKAVVSLLKTAIAKVSQEPDIQADWLRVDYRRSVEGLTRMLSEKRREFNLGFRVTGTGLPVYRQDSFQDEPPTYDYSDLYDDED